MGFFRTNEIRQREAIPYWHGFLNGDRHLIRSHCWDPTSPLCPATAKVPRATLDCAAAAVAPCLSCRRRGYDRCSFFSCFCNKKGIIRGIGKARVARDFPNDEITVNQRQCRKMTKRTKDENKRDLGEMRRRGVSTSFPR